MVKDIRPSLRRTAGILLFLQMTMLAVSSTALCCRNDLPAGSARASSDADHSCCPGVAPGQLCPMHKARSSKNSCRMTSGCATTDASLASLFSFTGVLPTVARVDWTLPRLATHSSILVAHTDHDSPPPLLPPRA
jgi:hypothetical protein